MKRREFSLAASAAATGALTLGANASWAQAAAPQEGKDYVRLAKPATTTAPAGKVEVVEFFWYNCPHCATLEPTLNEWVKRLPKDVAFRRVPRRFADGEVPQQQLYYALESMGLVDKLHAKVFAAVHGERRNLNRPEAIADWVAAQGVDRAKFMGQFSSFSVVTKATKAAQLQNAYRVDGVPALGVAGRFLTDGQMAGSNERALQVVESLMADVRAGR